MPDSITPVGAMIQPPNPQAVMNSLSSILGLAQERQNLQTGAFRQQEVQAGAVQAQQTARETQAAAQLLSDPIGNGILQTDGKTPTPNAQSIIMRTMPTTGASRFSDIVTAAQHKVDFDNAKMNLNLNERQAFNSTVAGLAAGAKTPDEVSSGVDAFLESVKGSPVEGDFQTLANTFKAGLKHVSTKSATPDQPEPWRQFATQYGRAVLGAPATVGTGGIGVPQGTTNAAGAIVNRAPVSGAVTPAPGAPPGSAINPTTPTVAAATAAGTGQVNTDNQVFARTMAAGANAQRGIELAQRVEQEAGMVRTGQFSQEFANRLTVLQQHDPSITARQLLQKDAMNLKTLAEEGATTDAERNQIGGGFPSPETMDPDAVQKAARYWQGSFRMIGARRDNAIAHVSQNGTTGLALKDAAFMANASPGRFAPPEPKDIGVLKEGQTGMSKSGKPMIVRNGRWEYAR